MPTYFLDSSALVKAYRREEGTQRVVALLNGTDPLVAARLAQVEVSSAIVRRGRAGGVSARDIAAALAQLDRELSESFEVIELSGPVMARAIELSRVHALRAADAIQLACALASRGAVAAQEFIILGSDQEMNAAASAEGLSVLDPTQ